jgi:hypothetical protein
MIMSTRHNPRQKSSRPSRSVGRDGLVGWAWLAGRVAVAVVTSFPRKGRAGDSCRHAPWNSHGDPKINFGDAPLLAKNPIPGEGTHQSTGPCTSVPERP